jgi:YD repeat-containing protein
LSGHGYNTGDWVCISGANETDYDGWVQVARLGANTFTFTVFNSPSTPATGNIQVRKFATSQDVTTTDYDRLGRVVVSSDQRGVTHKYIYDTAGRLSADEATSLGDTSQDVDGTVRAIVTAYDDLGRVQKVTSYPNANGTGTPVNETQESYDGWGKLTKEWQSHNGAVVTSTAPSVQYTYSDGLAPESTNEPA